MVLIIESTSTTRISLAPPVALDTLIEAMSEITEPNTVFTNFVNPGRLPPRKRRSILSSSLAFTHHGEKYLSRLSPDDRSDIRRLTPAAGNWMSLVGMACHSHAGAAKMQTANQLSLVGRSHQSGIRSTVMAATNSTKPDHRRRGQKKHGLSHTPECRAWHHMHDRCGDPDHPSYHRYGGRGITVCAEWLDFETFYRDMGPRPSPKHTLERIKNDLGYCKDNCKWATRAEQAHNNRRTRLITFNGETLCLREWARRIGVHHSTIANRIQAGWSMERVLTRPG